MPKLNEYKNFLFYSTSQAHCRRQEVRCDTWVESKSIRYSQVKVIVRDGYTVGGDNLPQVSLVDLCGF